MITAVTIVAVACIILCGWIAYIGKQAELAEKMLVFDGHELNDKEFHACLTLYHNNIIGRGQLCRYLGIDELHDD